jgi:hypothetical protein
VAGETAEAIELRHRVRLELRASNFRAVRGVTLLAAVLDEVAFLREEGSALPDVELYRALKPALATTGGLILGISSPWAQRGLLWQKYRRHFGQDGDVLVWQADSRTMNPSLAASLVNEATEDDPEAAAAEWLGQFRSDLESYISSAVLDAMREVKPPFDPVAVAGELATFLQTYGLDVVQADKFAGRWVVATFARHGITVVQDAEPKSAVYLACLPLLTGQRCDLLDLPGLRGQLTALERRRRAGGRDIVDHLPGAHDDVANAAAGALVLAALRGAGDAGVLACEREPSDLLAAMMREFGRIEPYFGE